MACKKQSDCEIVLDDVENIFESIEHYLDVTIDEKKSKIQVLGGVFNIGKSLLKLGWSATKCVVKNTPKAIVTVANVKRGLIDDISEEYARYAKELKEDALDEKIKRLKKKAI